MTMGKLTVLDLKKWLKKEYPHLYYSENMKFGDENQTVSKDDFDDFKTQMNRMGSMDYKAVHIK